MNFKQLSNGSYEGFAILKKIEKKTSVRGSVYLDIILGDSDGEISAKKWDFVDGFEAEDIVKVRGEKELYNGKEQFRITQMRKANDGEADMALLVAAAPFDGEAMWQKLYDTVMGFSDNELKNIVAKMLQIKKEALLNCPAALRLHHAMRGGLLYHTLAMVKLAQAVAAIYPNIDRDLLLSGVILHDLAKESELDVTPMGLPKGYTTQGDLIGHLVKGALELETLANEHGFNREKIMLLQHMVISHHTVPEYGAAVRPMFLEAIVLGHLDNLDANIFEITSATSKVQPGAFTDRQWALDNRKLFNHGRTDPSYKVNID